MYSSRTKKGVFLLEGLNSVSTTYYFYYIFFYMRAKHGFGDFENLWLGAFIGFTTIFAAMHGGKFGQRRGSFAAIKRGFGIMAASLFVGSFFGGVAAEVLTAAVCAVGMGYTWPNLEAMISDKEPPVRLQRMIGIYNMVWATCGALAYFTGGAMLDNLGLRSFYLVPAGILAVEFAVAVALERQALAENRDGAAGNRPAPAHSVPAVPREQAKAFLNMAWVANPFAYIAISSAVAVIPAVASRFELGPTMAGFVCSIWLFARAGAFLLFWLWPGWHYRFRWMAAAYALLVGCFALTLLAPSLWILVAAQTGFGLAMGLIYYSSLYYSMDASDAKGEHGGFHEAAIGAGNFAGPAVGAAALWLWPAQKSGSVWAVSVLLGLGMVWLLAIAWFQLFSKPVPEGALAQEPSA